jgi:hypothetical protein
MNIVVQIEHRASSRRGKHEGESSIGLCDRLSRTRDNSQRQLPTNQDYAVPTREYQTDQSSLKTAPTAARSVLEQRRKQTHRSHRLTRSLHIRPMHSSSSTVGPKERHPSISDEPRTSMKIAVSRLGSTIVFRNMPFEHFGANLGTIGSERTPKAHPAPCKSKKAQLLRLP